MLEVDGQRKSLLQQVEELRRQGNANIADLKGKPSDEQISKGKQIKQQLIQKLADREIKINNQ